MQFVVLSPLTKISLDLAVLQGDHHFYRKMEDKICGEAINLYLNDSGVLVSGDGTPVTIEDNKGVSPALVAGCSDGVEVATEELKVEPTSVRQNACTTENGSKEIQQHPITPSKRALDKMYRVMKDIDDDIDSEDDFTSSQQLRKPGRKQAEKRMPYDRKSNVNGSKFVRAIADNEKFAEDAQAVYNYCKDGVNPYPKGSNARRELPRKSKNYYVNNSILYLSKSKKGKSEYTVHNSY